MLALVALTAVLIADLPASPAQAVATPTATEQEYQTIAAAAGRSSADQVRLAYWCEAHGLTVERLRHLARAVLADPANATARGLLGLVAREGRWLRPDAVADRQHDDPTTAALLAAYDTQRSATPYTAEAQLALGIWAEEHGLREQARAHLTAATRLDPKQDQAWKRLGYVRRDGRWVTDAQLAAERADAEAQQQADAKWRTLLTQWRALLARPSKQAEAEAGLLGVTDPRAVASVLKVFGTHEADQPRAVQLLGQIDSPAAARGLAALAVFGKSVSSRRAATETLRGRDAREYADLLIALIRPKIRYQMTPVGGPGAPGTLTVEGTKANVKRVYAPPASVLQPGDQMEFDPRFGPVVIRDLGMVETPWVYPNQNPGLVALGQSARANTGALAAQGMGSLAPVAGGLLAGSNILMPDGSPDPVALTIATSASERPFNTRTHFRFELDRRAEFTVAQLVGEAQQVANAAQRQLASDKETLDRINAETDAINDRVVGILQTATGQNLPGERDPWARWWVNLVGYRYNSTSTDAKPTIIEPVTLSQRANPQPTTIINQVISFQRISCFGAGTLVQTMAGPRAIESLHVGDMVLTQSTTTGALGYQAVLVTHHNPPSGTFRIRLAGSTIVSSDFHRFWVARRGWVMARDLKPGDPIRTLGGILPIEAVEPGQVEPVFNLDVATDADFFAGPTAALVHDNTLPDPRLIPFDLPTTPTNTTSR